MEFGCLFLLVDMKTIENDHYHTLFKIQFVWSRRDEGMQRNKEKFIGEKKFGYKKIPEGRGGY